MINAILAFLGKLLLDLFNNEQEKTSEYNQGQTEAENKTLKDTVKRGKDAQKTKDSISDANDDDLDDLMRSNRTKED